MLFGRTNRRAFIAALSGAAAWPVVARAQQPDRIRRVGVLMAFDENDTRAKRWLSRFTQGLSELGWTDGRNLRTDVRWAGDDVDRMRMFAKQIVALQPDVILAFGTPVTAALQRETRTVPIVFAIVSDPVGEGFVASLSHPGGNITGFHNSEEYDRGQVAGATHADCTPRQTGRHDLQSRYCARTRKVLHARFRSRSSIVQRDTDRSARAQHRRTRSGRNRTWT